MMKLMADMRTYDVLHAIGWGIMQISALTEMAQAAQH
jgi:hypothetical protein